MVAAGVALLLSGCARETNPRDIPPGSLHDVSQASEGMGRNHASRDEILDMGVTPLRGWVQPDIPLIRNAESIPIWFFPAKSANGRTIRDGYWAHHVIRDFSWGLDEAMHERAVTLNALSAMSIDSEGNLIIDRSKLPTGVPATVPRGPQALNVDGTPKLLPFTQGDEANVIVVDERTGATSTTTTRPVMQGGQINMDRLRSAIEQTRQDLQSQGVPMEASPNGSNVPRGGPQGSSGIWPPAGSWQQGGNRSSDGGN